MGAFIELGRGINEVGELSPGIEMPAGAVWQPAFWAYGTARVAGLATDGNRRTIPGGDSAEVMARMDLFANLQLTGTERVHAHFRPLDQRGGFAGRVLSPKESSTTFDIDLDADQPDGRPHTGHQRTAERPAQGLRRRVGGGRILHRDQSPTRSVLRQWILGVGGFRASGQNGRPQDGENDDDSAAVRVESRMNF